MFWDGRDWNRVTKTVNHDIEMEARMKRAYLHGVLDGRLYGYLKTWTKNATLANDVFGEDVDYLSIRELVKSLDNFFDDPLNSYIPVPSAVIIANLYAQRVPLNIIDNYINESREWVNSLVIDLADDEKELIMEIKNIFADTKLGKYKVNLSAGKNYGKLKELKL